MVVYRGPSLFDGVTPVVVIATGDSNPASKSSANRKTGNMIQVWIIRDDMEPHTAIATGGDVAICGTCPHRSKASGGTAACYVAVWQGPLSMYRAYRRDVDNGLLDTRGRTMSYRPDMFAGRKVRFGAYGDPAAVPIIVWRDLLTAIGTGSVTGYTHAWQTADPGFAEFCMASADSVADGVAARRRGYRNFIVRSPGEPKPVGAIVCPAAAESGKRTVCADCLQCGGTSAKRGRGRDITIIAHGATASSFRPLRLAVV
jgi:hypothetical protein